jgi:peptide/nickel transport system permease protein
VLLAVGTLLVLSVIAHLMIDTAVDPLEDLRLSTNPNKELLIANRTAMLELDKPWIIRYWHWLSGFVTGDWGEAWVSHEPVTSLLGNAISVSFSLVIVATALALVLGCTIGIVSALRQYTGFDYSITFVSFVLYSLPVFWVAVLLKQFMAIGLNDFLGNPSVNWTVVIAVSVVFGLFWMGAIGGSTKRKGIVFGTAAVVTGGTLAGIIGSGWLDAPRLSIIGVAVIGLAGAFAVTLLTAGTGNRLALFSSLTTWGIGVALYYPLMSYFNAYAMSWSMSILLLLSAIGVACLVGFLFGGPDRAVSMRGASFVAAIMGILTWVDRLLQSYPAYYNNNLVHKRPIGTIGAMTPNLQSDYWIMTIDRFTHILLPTIALVLISFASYTRYQRGAMLEVMNQDYIRTARAKGLPERVVIMRHALRNALMPLAAVIPIDLTSLVGGAVMTETIFGWSGMGRLFITSLRQHEIDPLMSYIIIVGAFAIIMALLADFLYALLDPRIRVNA